MPNYLVVATSGRAIAQSLKSLGHSVFVIDGFADSDTCAAAIDCMQVKRTQFGLGSQEVISAVSSLEDKVSFDGLFYDAALESNPGLLGEINIQPVFGNSIKVLENCTNPKYFFSVLDKYAIPYPEVVFKTDSSFAGNEEWVTKHACGTGGMGVTHKQENLADGENTYKQKKIEGLNFSITFLSNAKEYSELGFNTIWSQELSKDIPYAYSGAINTAEIDGHLKNVARSYVNVVTKEFGLVGLNSIDFILADDSIYMLEINPRIPATYELYETKQGDLLQQHMDACLHHKLPGHKQTHLLRAHAIVYAPFEIFVPANMSWPLWTADRPCDQEIIKTHEPVCSIFAGGQNSAQVCEMIKTRRQTILAKLADESDQI